jgi:hypothetical protein
MTDLDNFIQKLKSLCSSDGEQLSIESARAVVSEINRFLYTTYDGIGTVNALGNEWQFFSEFHRFWNENHRDILDLKINDDTCKSVADALHDIYVRTSGRAFSEVYDTNGLSAEEICRVRMLTANQDFRGSRNFMELSEIYRDDPTSFDVHTIFDDPANFVRLIGGTNLSQNDKRSQYAKKISQFLIEKNASPYDVIDFYHRDVSELHQAMISYNGTGYGNKKTDMFIRDMIVLGVWNDVSGFDTIDVASDVNTIKVALRTGILSSTVPLVSSFLDIFDLQYGYVDEMNAKAWRRVWEIWNEDFPDEAIQSPCLLDYFIYNVVGKQFCKEILCILECEHGHRFKWHSPRNRTCQVCFNEGNRGQRANLVAKVMPCTDNDGSIAITQTAFYRSEIASPNLDECPFRAICDNTNKRQLEPPKAISIMGQTGWTTAYAQQESGGGGLMA